MDGPAIDADGVRVDGTPGEPVGSVDRTAVFAARPASDLVFGSPVGATTVGQVLAELLSDVPGATPSSYDAAEIPSTASHHPSH